MADPSTRRKPSKKSPPKHAILAFVSAIVLFACNTATAADLKAELDFVANEAKLDTHFAKYGPAMNFRDWIARERTGFRFKLPSNSKDLKQSGMYSHFSVAGDFEMSATFNWIYIDTPNKGYGVSTGIAVDAKAPLGAMVSLQRTYIPEKGKGPGFAVTVGTPKTEGGGIDYKTEHFPTEVKKAVLILKREKREIICMVHDKPKEEPRELVRVPFHDSTISKVRLFADPGGSPTTVDTWVGNLQIKAEEITTTGKAKLESQGSGPWLFLVLAILLAAAGYGWWRRGRLGEP